MSKTPVLQRPDLTQIPVPQLTRTLMPRRIPVAVRLEPPLESHQPRPVTEIVLHRPGVIATIHPHSSMMCCKTGRSSSIVSATSRSDHAPDRTESTLAASNGGRLFGVPPDLPATDAPGAPRLHDDAAYPPSPTRHRRDDEHYPRKCTFRTVAGNHGRPLRCTRPSTVRTSQTRGRTDSRHATRECAEPQPARPRPPRARHPRPASRTDDPHPCSHPTAASPPCRHACASRSARGRVGRTRRASAASPCVPGRPGRPRAPRRHRPPSAPRHRPPTPSPAPLPAPTSCEPTCREELTSSTSACPCSTALIAVVQPLPSFHAVAAAAPLVPVDGGQRDPLRFGVGADRMFLRLESVPGDGLFLGAHPEVCHCLASCSHTQESSVARRRWCAADRSVTCA